MGNSSNGAFQKGTTAANLGIGLIHFGSYSGLLFSGSGYSRTPLINLSIEHGIIDNVGPGVISVGGIVGFRRASFDYANAFGSYGYKWSSTDIFVGARGIYHYALSSNPKLDTYGGLTVGVRLSNYSWKYDDSYPESLRSAASNTYTNAFSGLFVGARYNFSDNLGVFGEFGYDIALLKVGLSAKF